MTRNTMLGLTNTMVFGAPPADFVPPAAIPSYSTIYAFGDSLSDAGNLYEATDGLIPTGAIYSDGRFSNGPVWVQDLATDLGLPAVTPSLSGGTDFAYGGAETGQDPLHTAVPLDLPSQFLQFLAEDPKPSANALYTLSIGSNDLLDAIPEYATDPLLAVEDLHAAVNNEAIFIAELAFTGAKNFLVLNVPNLGVTPTELGTGSAAAATSLSALYDLDLGKELASLASRDHLHIHVLNAFQLIDDAIADPSKFGLTNVTTPVWTGNYDDPTSGTLNATGAAQNGYLFFDHLHPTSTGHMAIASLALDALR